MSVHPTFLLLLLLTWTAQQSPLPVEKILECKGPNTCVPEVCKLKNSQLLEVCKKYFKGKGEDYSDQILVEECCLVSGGCHKSIPLCSAIPPQESVLCPGSWSWLCPDSDEWL